MRDRHVGPIMDNFLIAFPRKDDFPLFLSDLSALKGTIFKYAGNTSNTT